MSLGERFKERLRIKLNRWIEREKAATGCTTKAIKNVAKGIGKSASWIYAVINRHPRPVAVHVEHYAIATFPKMFAKAGRALRIPRKHKPALAINITIPERAAELIERSQA